MWLTFLAGLALGVIDVLAPLRLNRLGAERRRHRRGLPGRGRGRGRARPVGRSAGGPTRAHGPGAPVARGRHRGRASWPRGCGPLPVLVVLLVIGLPGVRDPVRPGRGDDRRRGGPSPAPPRPGLRLGQPGLGGGQGIAAAASGALAQATSTPCRTCSWRRRWRHDGRGACDDRGDHGIEVARRTRDPTAGPKPVRARQVCTRNRR